MDDKIYVIRKLEKKSEFANKIILFFAFVIKKHRAAYKSGNF